MDAILFMLERGKKYKLASLALSCLLQHRSFECSQRGKWWHRLAINLKHLKLKVEALKCCDNALLDEFVKDEKLNLILRVRLSLFIDVHRMIKKSKLAIEKANKKRVKKKQPCLKTTFIECKCIF
jgi:hypothetical protein